MHFLICGWFGRAMVLGSFQCWGILLLLHIVGPGPAVLARGAGRVVFVFFFFYFFYFILFFFIFYLFFFRFLFFFISSILSSFSDASSLERRLDILKYCGLGHYYPTVVVSYYRRCARQVLVNRLVGLSLSRNSVNG